MSDDEMNLFRMVRREMAEGFESIREEYKRTREAIERLALLHEDVAIRVGSLEQSAAKRRAAVRR